MYDKDVIVDLLNRIAKYVHRILVEITHDTLYWQPDREANNIAVTIWHISRSMDLFKVRFIEDRPVEEELWFAKGWVAKTGYDPRGKGWNEFGNLAGYTQSEVQEIPNFEADELLQYFDEASNDLKNYVETNPRESLHDVAPGCPGKPQTGYECIMNLLVDSLGHLGEIIAIIAMKERKNRAA